MCAIVHRTVRAALYHVQFATRAEHDAFDCRTGEDT